jgi:hypothetical protein
MIVYQASHFGYCEDPLTLSLSPRGEGTLSQRAQPDPLSSWGEGTFSQRAQRDSLSPWGEGWGEGVFLIQPGDMA